MKRNQGAERLGRVLGDAVDRMRYVGWQELVRQASQGIRRQKDIRERFESIEMEKGVLEEEYGNALTLNEDL
jgi:hypothetical protein